jgi:hypothetical protein
VEITNVLRSIKYTGFMINAKGNLIFVYGKQFVAHLIIYQLLLLLVTEFSVYMEG